jgi:hypothetical protein
LQIDAISVVGDTLRRWNDNLELPSEPRMLFSQELTDSFALCDMAAAQVISDFAESARNTLTRHDPAASAPEMKPGADAALSSDASPQRSPSEHESCSDFKACGQLRRVVN